MNAPLWAPWRMEYILSEKDRTTCIFCGVLAANKEERDQRLVVVSNPSGFVMLNKYPFAPGHLLIVPHEHVSSLDALPANRSEALFGLVRESAIRLRRAVKAEGMNIGLNLGAAAGAGVAEHLHVHIVPRWPGDTNFMPVVADTRVVPQALEATRAHLTNFFGDLEQPKREASP